jgi:hypothetical protein
LKNFLKVFKIKLGTLHDIQILGFKKQQSLRILYKCKKFIFVNILAPGQTRLSEPSPIKADAGIPPSAGDPGKKDSLGLLMKTYCFMSLSKYPNKIKACYRRAQTFKHSNIQTFKN